MSTDKSDPDDFVETSLPGFADPEDDVSTTDIAKPTWELKKLKPVHLQICALLAQGMKQVDVAKLTGVTKEYVWMLLQQPLIKDEMQRISSIAQVRLEGMYEKSVDVIAEVMDSGSHADKLKAVRIHGELTKRIGRPDPMANTNAVDPNRLAQLSERLVGLLEGKQNVHEGKFSKAGAQDV